MNETKWLTVKEASLLSAEMGLNRTSKTIRSWARRGHVEATKQTTRNGEMWVLDRDELVTKIKSELEFKEQQELVQTSANQDLNTSEPVQTRTDQFEPVRTSANQFEHSGMNRGEPQADTQVPNFILENQNLSIGAKLVYAMMLRYAWSDNHCFPGQKTLADDAGMGVRSVVRYNKELAEKGFITTKRRGLGKVNVYELHMTVKKKK